jgi:hypothetical protein
VPSGRLASALLFIGVQDSLTAQASTTTINQGQSVSFTGTVLPNKAGHVIYLQQQDAGGDGWHAIAVSRVAPGSTYSIPQAFYEAGKVTVRVKITGGPDNQGAVSSPFTITVNPIPASSLVPANG